MLCSLLTVTAVGSVQPKTHCFNRRTALLASAAAVLKSAAPAGAEDDDILDGIVERAQSGQLSIAKVMDRARQNSLVELSSDSLSCEVLDSLVRVDQGACDSAASSIKTLQGALRRRSADPALELEQAQAKVELQTLQTIKKRIDKQVTRLVSLEEEKGCLDAVATYDAGTVAQRARLGRLTTDRAVQRARSNQLVSVEDAKLGCSALDALRAVDRRALMEMQRARAASDESAAADELLRAEENMRAQLTKADTRFANFCEGVIDLTAGVL
jgi:hypothetical protein|eukprot:1164416-Prymnesium_polylepis.1